MSKLYRPKPSGIYLDSIFASRLSDRKSIRYSIETDNGSDPHPDWYSIISKVHSGYGPMWTSLQTRSA